MADANGRNNAHYVRNNQALKRNLPASCDWCLQPIDLSLHHNHAMAWTSDHLTELRQGGDLYGPQVPMHRRCNSAKAAGAPRPTPAGTNTEHS